MNPWICKVSEQRTCRDAIHWRTSVDARLPTAGGLKTRSRTGALRDDKLSGLQGRLNGWLPFSSSWQYSWSGSGLFGSTKHAREKGTIHCHPELVSGSLFWSSRRTVDRWRTTKLSAAFSGSSFLSAQRFLRKRSVPLSQSQPWSSKGQTRLLKIADHVVSQCQGWQFRDRAHTLFRPFFVFVWRHYCRLEDLLFCWC